MNPQQNTMSPELQQAIAARAQTGAPVGQLSQTQQGAPAPMPPQGAQNPMSAPSQSPAGAVPGASGQAGPTTPSTSEDELITKALIQRQKQLGEFKKAESQPTIQQMPVS